MKNPFRRFSALGLVSTAITVLLVPSMAYAFSYTITEYPPSSPVDEVYDIVNGPDGNLWYLATSGSKLSAMNTSGTIVHTYSIAGANSMTVGSDGNIWVNEPSHNKVEKVTTSGTITDYAVHSGGGTPTLAGMATGSDGNVWVVEQDVNKIAKITPTGSVTEYSMLSSDSGMDTSIMTLGPDGNVWYTESANDKVAKVTPSGTITEYSLSASSLVQYITSGPDGNIWAGESGGNKIARVTPSGTVTEFAAAGCFPAGITAGPDGNIWFGCASTNKMVKMSTAGAVLSQFTIPTSSANPNKIVQGPDGNLWFGEYSGMHVGQILMPHAPGITNHSAAVATGSSVTVDVLSGVSGNPDLSTLTIVSGPSHGTAVDPPGTITYTPTKGYIGADSLTYKVCSADDNFFCSTAVLSFSVTVAAPDTGFGINSANPLRTLIEFSLVATGLLAFSYASRKFAKK